VDVPGRWEVGHVNIPSGLKPPNEIGLMARLKRLQSNGPSASLFAIAVDSFSGDSKKQIPSGEDNKKGKGY
jgi:hypothetical protein